MKHLSCPLDEADEREGRVFLADGGEMGKGHRDTVTMTLTML